MEFHFSVAIPIAETSKIIITTICDILVSVIVIMIIDLQFFVFCYNNIPFIFKNRNMLTKIKRLTIKNIIRQKYVKHLINNLKMIMTFWQSIISFPCTRPLNSARVTTVSVIVMIIRTAMMMMMIMKVPTMKTIMMTMLIVRLAIVMMKIAMTIMIIIVEIVNDHHHHHHFF